MSEESILKGQISIFESDIFNVLENKKDKKVFMLDGNRYTITLKKCNYAIDGYKTEYRGEQHILLNSMYGKRNSIRTVHKLIKEKLPVTKEHMENKEYKIIDDVFNGVENLFYKIQNRDLEGMEELEKYEFINSRIGKIIDVLIKMLKDNKEGMELVEELDLLNSQLISMEALYYFKQGINTGIQFR
ncbi:hypothetical protein ELS18_08495 [Clostridium perfringens]|uniref:hypothetical protein n=1 Tax=Clostridium perfringens TaxID=1502 RepID=UPI000F8F33FB|nr:hypothetical protein [Clostridium perfringens]RUR38052.1 hypothetical protein ELS18_08495 [Clostridium perfringens]